DQVLAPVCSLAWRVLLVARALQQTARIPVFEPGRVLKIGRDAKDASLFRVAVAIPLIDHYPRQKLTVLINAATQVTNWAAAHHANPPSPEALYRQLQDKVIPSLRSIMPAGVSTVPILDGAYRNNIPFRHLGAAVFQLGWGARSHLIDRSAVDADSAIGAKLTQNKHWTARLIRTAGLPAPEHHLVRTLAEAEHAANEMGWPLVVKPADRDRSEGVTIGINTLEKLREGFSAAAALSRNILVEREVPGICYRLLIANGRLLYALSRKPKTIMGDGRHTLSELLQLEEAKAMSKPPWRRGKAIKMDAPTLAALGTQGLGPDSVPAAGQQVALRDIESSEWGGDIGDATAQVHPDNIDIALRAAKLFGLRNAGIDIISADIGQPWHENGAIINEVNYAPYFGGNPIAKAKLPDFFGEFMAGDGRIPIIVYVGGEAAWQQGASRQLALREAGVNCYLTSHAQTLNGRQKPMPLPQLGLFQRALALLMNRDVEALILVIQSDELRYTGLPVDR
ncbi:MAG: carboxylate--amine ligase, partial [Pseudomonadota bacterium]